MSLKDKKPKLWKNKYFFYQKLDCIKSNFNKKQIFYKWNTLNLLRSVLTMKTLIPQYGTNSAWHTLVQRVCHIGTNPTPLFVNRGPQIFECKNVLFPTLVFTMNQRFSIKFKSGDCGGQSTMTQAFFDPEISTLIVINGSWNRLSWIRIPNHIQNLIRISGKFELLKN